MKTTDSDFIVGGVPSAPVPIANMIRTGIACATQENIHVKPKETSPPNATADAQNTDYQGEERPSKRIRTTKQRTDDHLIKDIEDNWDDDGIRRLFLKCKFARIRLSEAEHTVDGTSHQLANLPAAVISALAELSHRTQNKVDIAISAIQLATEERADVKRGKQAITAHDVQDAIMVVREDNKTSTRCPQRELRASNRVPSYRDPSILSDATEAHDDSEINPADDQVPRPRSSETSTKTENVSSTKHSPNRDDADSVASCSDEDEAGDLYYIELSRKCEAIVRERRELRERNKVYRAIRDERLARKRRLHEMDREIKSACKGL